MTISQYVDVARRPDLYTFEQVEDAFGHWSRRAMLSSDEHAATAARIWRRMCAEALQAKED